MATPPLPDVPCVRVRLIYSDGGGQFGGSRFFISYSGSAPSAANCVTLATDISSAWGTDLAPLCASGLYDLVEVDVLDIASTSGNSGAWTGTVASSRSGTTLPLQCATNVEYDIGRRYRGGKPRMFLPPGVESDLLTQGTYSSGFTAAATSGVGNFFSAIAALSVGSMGTLKHVNLSYYSGFTNHTGTSGRARAVPTYRATALHDNVTSYSAKNVVGSQRRRRTASTP